MRILRTLSALALATPLAVMAQRTAAAQPVRPGSAAGLLERSASLYTGAGTLRAEFTQRIRNPITSSETPSAGTYLQRGAGVFSVSFSQPAGDRIVSDGRTLWVFVPSVAPGQVLKMPVGANVPGGVDLVGQFFTTPSRKFAVTDGGVETLSGVALRKLVLVPRAEMGLTRAVLWVIPTSGALKQLEVTEASGLVRILSFSRIDRGVTLPAGAFTFTVPRGITVVDQAALTRGM
jgi:outer membrane lipoprotein carrier protein